MLRIVSYLFVVAAAAAVAAHPSNGRQGPRVHVKNGTLQGVKLPAFDQELFLGVPFAQPPVGDLRLRHPVSLNSTWKGVKDATKRSTSCPGYAGFNRNLTMSEDCLTVDIVRPIQTKPHDKLPVYVWIYGGGFTAGGSADQRYNTSYLVNSSIAINKPIIAVQLNYRVGGWGFLASKEMAADGALNIGLYDQRLALRWVQENIGAFGGDPNAVTIGGESAGGFSVGYHLVGFDGKNDNLFRAAILQSGTAMGPAIPALTDLDKSFQPIYDNITAVVGCSKTTNTLDCLRKVSYTQLFQAFAPFVVTPVLDGDFLRRLPSRSYEKGKVANVAVLVGSNTDEGTASFFGPRGTLNTTAEFNRFAAGLGGGLNDQTVQRMGELYPDDPAQGCPFNTGSDRFAEWGSQYKRGAALVGDAVIVAGARATAEYHAARKPTYKYRFDQSPWNGVLELIATEAPVYATHYAEISYVFNVDPSVSVNQTNWIGPIPEYYDLSKQMARAWVSFVHSQDPNTDSGLPQWPEYSCGAQNMVFKVNNTRIEKDNWRIDQLKFLKTIFSSLLT